MAVWAAQKYDATQQQGEIRTNGERSFSAPEKVSGAALIPPKVIHEARQLRDAEAADPGAIRRTLDARLQQGQELTKAAVREAVANVVQLADQGSAELQTRPPVQQ
ncbi:hypothetical protein ACRAWG_01290 [Methylobacterium sp. P31]